jgi:uncharacterized phosphosugar-binding protein
MQVDSAASLGAALRGHLAKVESENAETLDRVSGLLLDVVRADGLIYTAGSGHSLALVLETFYRAGGLACVRPVYQAGLLPFNGARASTVLERIPGLAETGLAAAEPGERDAAVIFSNSGINVFPVELAQLFRTAGTPVVAVVSRPHMDQAEPRAPAKLGEVATHLIDTLVPPGDAAYPAGGANTAAMSSLVSVYCWNLLLARLADGARQAGVTLPLWTSANIPGGEARNAELFARYRTRIPQL